MNINYPNPMERMIEIDSLVDLYNRIGEKEKMIAELYAGGKGTVTPPGMWNIFALYVSNYLDTEIHSVELFYLLNSILFQTSIIVWDIKMNFNQSRPIQDIRIRHSENIVSNGIINVQGNIWTPYLKTPPFPDYISGHSTFSSAAAYLFEHYYKVDIKKVQSIFSNKHLTLFSPIFESPYRMPSQCGNIYIPKRSSLIQSSFPSCMIELYYNSWDELAKDCGMSRVYGGIHTMSSNIVGSLIGKEITKNVLESKNITI